MEEKDIRIENEVTPKKERKNKKYNVEKEVLEWIFSIAIALVLAFFIKYFVGTFTTVRQVSMYPTLENSQKLWLNRTIRTFGANYKRGDIATFEAPRVENIYVSNESPKAVYDKVEGIDKQFIHGFLEFGKISLIKRVIGLPGDKIEIKNGNVYVNGELQKEKYINGNRTDSYKLTNFVVPEGYYFLMGDNRAKSSDCREFGCIPKEKLEGKAVVSVWPLDRIGQIKERKAENE